MVGRRNRDVTTVEAKGAQGRTYSSETEPGEKLMRRLLRVCLHDLSAAPRHQLSPCRFGIQLEEHNEQDKRWEEHCASYGRERPTNHYGKDRHSGETECCYKKLGFPCHLSSCAILAIARTSSDVGTNGPLEMRNVIVDSRFQNRNCDWHINSSWSRPQLLPHRHSRQLRSTPISPTAMVVVTVSTF